MEKSERKSRNRKTEHNENKDSITIDEEQIYLRNDLNKLFDNMTVSANFNLRKISEDRRNESKISSKGESVEIKLINLANETKPTRISFTNNETKGITENFSLSNKKNSTILDWNQENDVNKGTSKIENFNKLLKKNDKFLIANANKEAVGVKNRIKVNIGMSSTFQVQNGGEENKGEFSATKYNMNKTQQHQRGIRSKIMSMSSKGVSAHRFSTEISRDEEKSLMKIKRSKRTETENIELEKIEERKNNYNELEKKYNKGGPLKFKHVENWLNNIIQEYCHDEYFDTSLASAALKKYYIDSNSLMSNGVEPNDVNRIYNSLFVYSIGFNNLLKQISKGNKELVKNIWKVYSLLLEYCAAGSYETLVGEMERDKLRKVEELKMEIEKRQEIIEKNEELNEEKNLNMYKELKRLKDENFNLANEREILMEDFQQADQAFNEEVSLRLKFENTINEIYGVHKELENKHGRLYSDFQEKMEELKKASEKYFEQTKIAQKYKYELLELKEKHNELKKINAHDKEHIDVLLIELNNMKENYFRTTKELEQSKSIILEKDRKMEQMVAELNNNKIILELREKSAKETHAEYQITLEENNKLFSVISEQRLEMEALLKEKKEFNQNVLKILAESSYYKKKYEATESQIKGLNQKVIDAESNYHKIEVQNDIFLKEIENYKNDLQSNYESIRNMHAKNFELEEELSYLRKFEGSMDTIMEEKNLLIQQLKDKVDQLETKILEETHEFMNLESKFKILETQLRSEKEMSVRRIEEFKKEQELMSTNETSLSKILREAQNEVDKYRNLLNNTLMDYKNEKFERANLTLNYEQILKVLEKKNEEQKEASIKINELEEEVLLFKEKYKLTHLNLLNTIDEFNNKISHLNKKIQAQKEVLDYKAHHQHPMIYEDVYHKLKREVEEHERTKENYENKLFVKESIIKQKEKEIQETITKFKQEIQKIEENFNKKEEKLKEEIEYEKEENQRAKKKLNALEVLEATYKEKVSIYEQKEADEKREQQFIDQIEEKNAQIRSLNTEIEKINENKKEEINLLEQRIKQVENEKLDFVYEFKTKKEREIREELDKKYQREMQTMRKEFDEEMKNKRLKYSPRFNQFIPGSVEEQDFKDFFKEMVRYQSLDEILKIKKEQLETMDDEESKKFYEKIEEFFKKSMNSQDLELSARNNLFSISKNSVEKDFIKSQYRSRRDNIPAYLQKIENTEEFKRRGSLARKLKNANEYYGKI